jgi:hypothetical protein
MMATRSPASRCACSSARAGADRRGDHFVHVLRVQCLSWAREAGQGAEREFEVFDRVERAGLVLGEEFGVAALVGVGSRRAMRTRNWPHS